ncbi:MAG: glycosyltransferase family 2 protein [Croceitalea sp.]|nr:glycosyltransferase family 2 protein [Croceitalea sp.]MBT8238089.1 glycosyltransferase family 2 protein [Croceitalea sp.]NNC34506.1 glycosyltransferase family 2 protein [Croceitalea sp.]NNL09805.1 glycosyltransferase family 2 protein [Croceitalea sp.]NNM19426.1 glycosyltransferase family 2 protein [Croceitalea sp.]
MDKLSNKISALLITFNEEENIDDVLQNLHFADEIIVVDSFSTDSTISKIKAYTHVKLIQREFKNYTNQKKFALEQASHDWVLFLDADERITPLLKNEILNIAHGAIEPVSAYYFLRTFMFQDEVLKFSGWQSDKNYRLFRKSKVKFTEDRIVHETLLVDGKTATLKNKLIHYSYTDYESYKHKMVKYGKMKALEEFRKGKRTKWYHFVFRPTYKFINHYIIRLGILDGKKGIIICYLNALGVWTRYKELRLLGKTN